MPASNTMLRIRICPLANASAVAICVVIFLSTSPKFFIFFVTWARFYHLTLRISKFFFFRSGPSVESQSFDAPSSNVLMSYIGVMSQRCTKKLPGFGVRCSGVTSGQNGLLTGASWSIDPWWMLAQAICCTRHLVAGSFVEPPTTASQGSFFVAALTFVVAANQCRQKAASVSQTIARRRLSRPLLRESNMTRKLRRRGCEFLLPSQTWSTSRCCERCFFFFGKFEPREYALRRSDGGIERCWQRFGHGPMCINTEKTVDILRHEGCSWRTRHFLCESGRSAKSWSTEITTRSRHNQQMDARSTCHSCSWGDSEKQELFEGSAK